MPATERLYYTDSHLIEFDALVIGVTERVSGWSAVTLDRTAFYPAGGGQPSDTGALDGARVVECKDEGETILHVIQGPPPLLGSMVKGRVDWPRRLDHIQQHSGQHILSQAFVTLFKAPTRGFRVMEQVCEIDVEVSDPSSERIERAVELANNVIWEDRPVAIRSVTAAEAAQLPLRSDSAREGDLRLIEIEGFDLTPCGGTHAANTGEVGLIAVRGWERAKGLTRIEFVCGRRALEDYRRANKTARDVAALFSAARDEAPKLTARLLAENKDLHHRLRTLEELAAQVEADQLLAEHQLLVGANVSTGEANVSTDGANVSHPELRVISQIFQGREAESMKRLAQALSAQPKVVALLGSAEKDTARLIFARSADAPGDMNLLIRTACEILGGRGGGGPTMAQGGGSKVDKLSEALAASAKGILANQPRAL